MFENFEHFTSGEGHNLSQRHILKMESVSPCSPHMLSEETMGSDTAQNTPNDKRRTAYHAFVRSNSIVASEIGRNREDRRDDEIQLQRKHSSTYWHQPGRKITVAGQHQTSYPHSSYRKSGHSLPGAKVAGPIYPSHWPARPEWYAMASTPYKAVAWGHRHRPSIGMVPVAGHEKCTPKLQQYRKHIDSTSFEISAIQHKRVTASPWHGSNPSSGDTYEGETSAQRSRIVIPRNITIPVSLQADPTGSPTEESLGKRSSISSASTSPAPTAKRSKSLAGNFDKLDLLCSATLELGPLQENPTGCSCPKSKCIALYCDCFKAGRRCNPSTCSCVDCKNTVAESGVNGARSKVRTIKPQYQVEHQYDLTNFHAGHPVHSGEEPESLHLCRYAEKGNETASRGKRMQLYQIAVLETLLYLFPTRKSVRPLHMHMRRLFEHGSGQQREEARCYPGYFRETTRCIQAKE